jgi:hypothetical protein
MTDPHQHRATPDLSPAAEAVLTAQAKARCLEEWSGVNDPPCHPSDADWNGCVICVNRQSAAAALRAAATQLHCEPGQSYQTSGIIISRLQLLTIANELDPK